MTATTPGKELRDAYEEGYDAAVRDILEAVKERHPESYEEMVALVDEIRYNWDGINYG